MHVVVVGCGRVGSGLAVALELIGHTVSIVDRNADAFRRLPSSFGGRRVPGIGFDLDILEQAGVKDAGAVAAVTSGDNSNIMVARIARETFGVERVVARIYDPNRAQVYQRLGIPTVATVAWTIDQVLRVLRPDSVAHDWRDAAGRVALLQRELPNALAGQRLANLSKPGRFWVTAVTRLGTATVVDEQVKGQQGDLLHIVCSVDAMADLDAALQGERSHT